MHPVDRLGEIRLQIRTLKQEAREIVTKIDAGACTDTGQRYRATKYRTTVTHPLDQPEPSDHYRYQAPVAAPYPYNTPPSWNANDQAFQQAQNLQGSMPSGKTFGEGKFGHQSYGVGEPAFGVGKRDGGDD